MTLKLLVYINGGVLLCNNQLPTLREVYDNPCKTAQTYFLLQHGVDTQFKTIHIVGDTVYCGAVLDGSAEMGDMQGSLSWDDIIACGLLERTFRDKKKG